MINFNNYLSFCGSLKGRTLTTLAREAKFTVGVQGQDILFIPLSTGKKPRKTTYPWIQKVIQRFNATGSFRPGDYEDLTRNASYHLAIFKMMQAPPSPPSQTRP